MKKPVSVCTATEKVLDVVLMRQNIKDAEKFVHFKMNKAIAEAGHKDI